MKFLLQYKVTKFICNNISSFIPYFTYNILIYFLLFILFCYFIYDFYYISLNIYLKLYMIHVFSTHNQILL